MANASAITPTTARPADPGERAARMSDGRVVLLVGHDVLLDPRRHAGETRVGYVVRMDRVGSAQPVDRIGSGRDAHSPAPVQSAPCVPFTSADVRLGSRYFRRSSVLAGQGGGETSASAMEADGDRIRVIPRTAAIPGFRAPPRRRGAGSPGPPATASSVPRRPARRGPPRRASGSRRPRRVAGRRAVRDGRVRAGDWQHPSATA